MSIAFLALQCSQCSTMQVKQQKKSSNKWTCTICNLKQSVLKIHARGPMARDLRYFVQQFNMARAERENGRSDGSDSFPPSQSYGSNLFPPPGSDRSRAATSAECPKKRTDWSEYLDTEDDQTGDNEIGVEVITEMPPKKPRITSSKVQPKIYEKKSFQKNVTKPKRGYEVNNSKIDANLHTNTDEIMEANNKKSVITNGRSRWSEYLETGEDPTGSSCTDLDANARENLLYDQLLVEEEVHPDFL